MPEPKVAELIQMFELDESDPPRVYLLLLMVEIDEGEPEVGWT